MKLDQQRKLFLKQRPQTEPTTLMHRPPSPGPFEDSASSVTDSYLDSTPSRPHYMKPLRRQRAQGATLIPTLDMFAVVRRRAVNVWEKERVEAQLPSFQRRVLPSQPLSTEELRFLQQEYALKAMLKSQDTPENSTENVRHVPARGRSARLSAKSSRKTKTEDPRTAGAVFITQLQDKTHDVRTAEVPRRERHTVVASRKHFQPIANSH